MPIDEKDQWTARRLKLAFAVADAAMHCDNTRGDEYTLDDHLCAMVALRRAITAYRAFMDAGKPKAKGKGRKR